MKVTRVQIFPVDGETSLKCFAQVTLDDSIKITGLKVFSGQDGFYLTYPRNPKSKKNLCFVFPTNPALRKSIEKSVIAEFQNAVVYE